MTSYHIENFGCRTSQADGAAIARQFAVRGLESRSAETAELVVLNTCTVTADADRAARAAVRRIHAQNPLAKIIVTGCYAQRAPEELAALPGVTNIVGNSHKHALADLVTHPTFIPIHTLLREPQIHLSDIFAHTQLLSAPIAADDSRTRPTLKVQDGCNNRCSFCVIPSVRGQSRSLPLTQVLTDIATLVSSGANEVVLSGINLGRWGRDLTPTLTFETLIEAILKETALPKLRLSSVEPMDWTNHLIHLVSSSPRIAKHAHVPMQSGSDAILRRMHRKYRPWHYRDRIATIRAAMPDAAIGADVMTGFPGETEADFAETLRLVDDLPLTYLHIFPYSARPGTPAAAHPNQVPTHTARQRQRELQTLIAVKKHSFASTFIGRTLSAITLTSANNDSTSALTDNFLELQIEGHHPPNRWLPVRIESSSHGTLSGRLT